MESVPWKKYSALSALNYRWNYVYYIQLYLTSGPVLGAFASIIITLGATSSNEWVRSNPLPTST